MPSSLTVQSFIDSLTPALPQFSLGAILGFASGYALKKLGRMALLIAGLLMIAVQLMASLGYVTVHWDRLQGDALPYLEGGARSLWQHLLGVLTTNLPFGGAFVAGLLVGLRAR